MAKDDTRAASGTARTTNRPRAPHVVDPAGLSAWARLDVDGCRDCRDLEDDLVALCGWHENLAAGAQVVDGVR